jgi:hypothetical protein
MARTFAFTLDLESDYASLLPDVRNRILERPERVDEVLAALGVKGIRGTAFVVGQVIQSYPRIIDVFEKHGWEFELHSYSHDITKPDAADELDKGRAAFIERFGRAPIGYRAPQGRITPEGIGRLVDLGFHYDASIFPSYFPNPLRYLAKPRDLHFWQVDETRRILEIPFTSVSPLRFTLSTSYMKLLGPGFYRAILRTFGFPEVICFDSHLHDFIVDESSYRELPPFWRFVYGRNMRRGVSITTDLLDVLQAEGYEFQFMSQIAATALASTGEVAMARANQ